MPETAELVVEGKKLSVSNLDKVLYPKVRFTKGQVIDYYIKIAPALLPPVSILLAYWAGGAFLMTVKRFAEHRYLERDGP